MEHSKLLALRNKQKRKRSQFVVRESKLYPRMKKKWKFPYGTSSSVRQRHRGLPALVSIGYGSPKAVRGLHSSGLEKVLVHNQEELLAIDPKKQGAVISSTLGNRKRLEILRLAVEKKIRILNVKDSAKLIEKIQAEFASRQKARKENISNKSRKHEEKKRKAEEKKKGEENVKAEKKESSLVEEKKEQQREEKEIVEKELIKRQ